MYPFPTELKNPSARGSWRKLINRNVETDSKNVKLWDPKKDSRVCSVHFVDGRPTAENPFPTEKLGYDATKRALFLSPPQKKRKSQPTFKMENYTITKVKKTKMGKDREKETSKLPYSTIKSYSQSNTKVDTIVDDIDFAQLEKSWEESNSDANNFNSSTPKFIKPTTPNPPNTPELFQKLLEYEKKICELEEKLNQPMHKKILNEKTCNFFTNLESVELFDKLHDAIAPLVRRRVRLPQENQEKRQFVTTPKKMGRERKLPSKDEFLLTLMKLRLTFRQQIYVFDLMCQRDYVQTFLNHGYEQWQNISKLLFLFQT